MLEQFDRSKEVVVEITKESGEKITTYDIGVDCSVFGELMLCVHE